MKQIQKNYQEPSRCQYGGVEYCHGEVLRALHSWWSLQICSNGKMKLLVLSPKSFRSAMKVFLSP